MVRVKLEVHGWFKYINDVPDNCVKRGTVLVQVLPPLSMYATADDPVIMTVDCRELRLFYHHTENDGTPVFIL